MLMFGCDRNLGSALTVLNDESVLRHAASLYSDLIASLTQKIGPDNYTTSMIIQPFPEYYNNRSQSNGGNVIGLDRIRGNAALVVLGIGVSDDQSDKAVAFAHAQLRAMTTKLKRFSVDNHADADLVYINYAGTEQDPLGSYGPKNVALMKEAARRFDPEDFWQRRTPGGFKLSRVASHGH
jgi:hypothetical protein